MYSGVGELLKRNPTKLVNVPSGITFALRWCMPPGAPDPDPEVSRLIDEVQEARLRLAKLLDRIKRHRAAMLDRTQAL